MRLKRPLSGLRYIVSVKRPLDFKRAHYLRITVMDNGVGMAPEDIPHALEPFTQVGRDHTPAQEGTGLGLPISKTLVELHGGRFEIISAPKQGTVITISLPIPRADRTGTDKPAVDIAVRVAAAGVSA